MLKITSRSIGNAAVLRCVGRIVAGREVTVLRETVMCHLAKHSVALDLSEVTVIDANGLGTLVFLHTCAYGIGSELKLVGLSTHVRSVFELTNLLSVFETTSDAIDAALGAPCETC
jgi:anti-anti-sigma factor